MNIFFDLEGTLLDTRKRLYTLFIKLVPSSGFSLEEYWEMKRSKNNHKAILTGLFKYTEEVFNEFEKKWLEEIESSEYLQYDTPIDGVFEVLDYLFKKYVLYIVTARQRRDYLLSQLNSCKLDKYFTKVVATENKFEKKSLIKSLGYTTNDFIIGDTGHDIQTGYSLGLKTIAVTYGFLKKEILKAYQPYLLIDSLKEISNIL
jgi:phosphoglycolate phosphatase